MLAVLQVLSGLGLAVAIALMLLFSWINLRGVASLARWIDSITIWKLIVPLVVAVVLMALSRHWGNLAIAVGTPTADGANTGLLAAVGSGGILFCLLGFRTAVDLAGEVRNPQRNVPLAMALGLGISLLIYLVLQLSFLVSVPPDLLSAGWANLSLTQHGGPLAALAIGLGLGWMVVILLIDAALSPSATAMAYLGVSARISWMMGRCRLLPKPFGHTNRRGVPDVSIIASLLVGSAMLLIGSWMATGGVVFNGSSDDCSGHGAPQPAGLAPATPPGNRALRGAVGNGNIGVGLHCSQLGGHVVRPCGAAGGRAGHWGAELDLCALLLAARGSH